MARGRPYKYGTHKLEVGQSHRIDNKMNNSVIMNVCRWNKKLAPKRFSWKVDRDGNGPFHLVTRIA
jgi:hypothetical protein